MGEPFASINQRYARVDILYPYKLIILPLSSLIGLPWVKPIKELSNKIDIYAHRKYGNQSCRPCIKIENKKQ